MSVKNRWTLLSEFVFSSALLWFLENIGHCAKTGERLFAWRMNPDELSLTRRVDRRSSDNVCTIAPAVESSNESLLTIVNNRQCHRISIGNQTADKN
jgi:hypothetical protein